MKVAEYALEQLHWILRRDPWVREIFLAGGVPLDGLAERILDIAYGEDSDQMRGRGLALWERMLGIRPAPDATPEARRKAVRARWLAGQPATLAAIQAVCDAWHSGWIKAYPEPGAVVLELLAGCGYLFPEDLDQLLEDLERIKPAHLVVRYAAIPPGRPAYALGYPAGFAAAMTITITDPDEEEE